MGQDAPTGFETAGALAELGARMVEARFRREHPTASDAAVAEAVRTWWSDRSIAPDGDAVGRTGPAPV